MQVAMLNDVTKCTACRGCQAACKQWNQLPAQATRFTGSYENPPTLSPITWTRVMFREGKDNGTVRWLFAKTQCLHCTDAACIGVCPTGAMYRTAEGTVKVDAARCIGCNYCVANCPLEVPRFDHVSNVVRKCTFCHDRITNGLKPACASACPTGAIQFGDRLEIVRMAQRRVAELRAAGNPRATVYGLDEMGGTAMVYVLADRPSAYGLVENPEVPLAADIWGAIFKPIRALAVAGAVGVGLLVSRQRSDTRDRD